MPLPAMLAGAALVAGLLGFGAFLESRTDRPEDFRAAYQVAHGHDVLIYPEGWETEP